MRKFLPMVVVTALLGACSSSDRPCLIEGETATILQVGDEEIVTIADDYYDPAGFQGPDAENPRRPRTEGGEHLTTTDTYLRLQMDDHIRVCNANGMAHMTLKVGDQLKGHEAQWLRRVF